MGDLSKSLASRRSFVRQLALLAGAAAVPPALRGEIVAGEKLTDAQICKRKFSIAAKESLQKRPIGEVMVAVGVSFLGTPYVAGTLEQPGDEHLVINLRELDCVTFVENTLALSRCIKLGVDTFEGFQGALKLIRYRNGIVDGYPSRLHYFSDWIDNNESKGVVRNISHEIGVAYGKQVNFMSSHPASYKQLANATYLEKIKEQESDINGRKHYYIPKSLVKEVDSRIDAGDIIGITTSTEGLDIIHTGIAIRSNGILKYLHAPLSKGKVQITEKSLVEYLASYEKHSGIMVARPLEPAA